MGSFAVILPAAGLSSRFGDSKQKKIYADLEGRAVWLRAIEPFLNRDDVTQIILAIHPEDRELFERRYHANAVFREIQVIEGGAERHDTVAMALEHVDRGCGFVAVHDAARPCVSSALIDSVFAAARELGAAIPGVPVVETLKRVDPDGMIRGTVSRANLVAVQTPQAFRIDLLRSAYANRDRLNDPITDDAQLVEALGHACKVVPGSRSNLKITTAEDLQLAALMIRSRSQPTLPPSVHPFTDPVEP